MYKSNNGNFKEGIVWWDTEMDPSSDVDVFFFIHDYKGRAKYKYGFKSLEIDLNLTMEERWSQYKSNLRNELRGASKELFETKHFDNPSDEKIEEFVRTFNSFAEFKKLPKLDIELIKEIANENKLTLSFIYKDKTLLTAHSHYRTDDKVRLYHSCSTNNEFSPKIASSANKELTEKDFIHFKKLGIKTYDFGGIGTVDGDNAKFEGIIRFKKSFGGKEVTLWKGVTPNGENGEAVYKKYWG